MTAIQSMGGRFETATLFPNAVVTATAAGASKVDLAPFEGHALVLLNAAAGGAGVTVQVKLRHCDTVDGSYTDVPNAAFAANTADTAQAGAIQINTNDTKQFIEAYFTVAGGTGAGAVALQVVAQPKYNH